MPRIATIVAIACVIAAALSEGESPLEDARTAQSNIEELTVETGKEIMRVEVSFAAQKLPIYEARNKKLEDVDKFWARVILNHPNYHNWVREADKEALFYLRDISVIPKNGTGDPDQRPYRVVMRFAKNPFFTDTELWRDMGVSKDSDKALGNDKDVSGIDYIGTRKAYDRTSFLNFFEKKIRPDQYIDSHFIDDFGQAIHHEIWANPFTYFDTNPQDDLAARTHEAPNLEHYGGVDPHTMSDSRDPDSDPMDELPDAPHHQPRDSVTPPEDNEETFQ